MVVCRALGEVVVRKALCMPSIVCLALFLALHAYTACIPLSLALGGLDRESWFGDLIRAS